MGVRELGSASEQEQDISLDAVNSTVSATGPYWIGAPSAPGTEDGVTVKVSDLSKRELEVFHALGEGASNRTIAAKLAITERTVKAHVAQILAKLRVESRLQAGIISFALRMSADRTGAGVLPPFHPVPVAGPRTGHPSWGAEQSQDRGDRGGGQDDR
jgi:DNA-binding CsgD family transcriptional regulator